jgi:hypothetical protein
MLESLEANLISKLKWTSIECIHFTYHDGFEITMAIVVLRIEVVLVNV